MNEGNEILLSKVKQKQLFYVCLYPIDIPKCISKWQSIFGILTNIKEVFIKMPICYERKSTNLHWNILHNAIFSEKRLQIMNKSDGICKICKTESETLTHLFYECTYIQPIWLYVEGICELLLSKKCPSQYEVYILLSAAT